MLFPPYWLPVVGYGVVAYFFYDWARPAQSHFRNVYAAAADLQLDGLVIVDGSVFTSNAHKNPTLTIMALAWRSTARLVERMKQGEI